MQNDVDPDERAAGNAEILAACLKFYYMCHNGCYLEVKAAEVELFKLVERYYPEVMDRSIALHGLLHARYGRLRKKQDK